MQSSHSGQLDVAHASQRSSLGQSSSEWQRRTVAWGGVSPLLGGLGLDLPPQAANARTNNNAELHIVLTLPECG